MHAANSTWNHSFFFTPSPPLPWLIPDLQVLAWASLLSKSLSWWILSPGLVYELVLWAFITLHTFLLLYLSYYILSCSSFIRVLPSSPLYDGLCEDRYHGGFIYTMCLVPIHGRCSINICRTNYLMVTSEQRHLHFLKSRQWSPGFLHQPLVLPRTSS